MHIFPKGLVHSLGPKLTIFAAFFFRQYRPGKCALWYSRTKKRLLAIKARSSKRRKMDIFQRGDSMVFVQIWPFFLLFLGNIGQGYSTTKKRLCRLKNKKFKMSKNGQFAKWVSPRFWFKIGHFSNSFFLGNICKENVFYDILERKNRLSTL